MAYTQFEMNNIVLRYFPDQKVLLMVPQANTKKNDLVSLKNKLDTFLQVTSIKTQKDGISMKLNQNSAVDINELLKSMGAQGGEEIDDASSIAAEPAEEKSEEEQRTQPPPPTNSPAQNMVDPNQQPQQVPTEGLTHSKVFNIFYESSFGTPQKKRQKSKRLGEYWQVLESAAGKKRMKIDSKDVLFLRQKFSKKMPNEERNQVLRALDSASEFFSKNIARDQGQMAADNFMDEYKSIDNLSTKEYAVQPEMSANQDQIDFGVKNSSMQNLPGKYSDASINGANFSDLEKFLNSDEKDDYDDIEIEEPTS